MALVLAYSNAENLKNEDTFSTNFLTLDQEKIEIFSQIEELEAHQTYLFEALREYKFGSGPPSVLPISDIAGSFLLEY